MTREQPPPASTSPTFPAAAVQLSPPRRLPVELDSPNWLAREAKRNAAATGLETTRCAAIASGDKTSAGHGKTGEDTAGHDRITREPSPTGRTAMTTWSYENAPATSRNNLSRQQDHRARRSSPQPSEHHD